MAKFGLFGTGDNPKQMQEFEGDWLEINGDIVCIVGNDGSGNPHAMAVIRLHPGYSVKKIKG